MNKRKDEIKISNMKQTFNIINMKSEMVRPRFQENHSGDWIEYGKGNLYPNELLDLYNFKSSKHQAILNRKSSMIGGNGWIKDNISIQLEEFYKNSNDTDTLDVILGKVSYDLEVFGGYSLIIKWTNNGKKIGAIKYVPFDKVRVSTRENKFYISNDWSRYRKAEFIPKEYQGYDPTLSLEQPVQILHHIEYRPGGGVYPIPHYSASMNWILSDYEISTFHYNSIINGFSGGFLLNFSTGVPSEEEMDEFQKEFKKKYTGSDNAGNIILTFSDGKDGAPELIPIELNTSDERFMTLSEQIRNEIFIGAQITNPQLFGVLVPGSLGGKTEMEESLSIFQAVYIDQKQKQIVDVFQKLADVNSIPDTLEIKKYEI